MIFYIRRDNSGNPQCNIAEIVTSIKKSDCVGGIKYYVDMTGYVYVLGYTEELLNIAKDKNNEIRDDFVSLIYDVSEIRGVFNEQPEYIKYVELCNSIDEAQTMRAEVERIIKEMFKPRVEELELHWSID